MFAFINLLFLPVLKVKVLLLQGIKSKMRTFIFLTKLGFRVLCSNLKCFRDSLNKTNDENNYLRKIEDTATNFTKTLKEH